MQFIHNSYLVLLYLKCCLSKYKNTGNLSRRHGLAHLNESFLQFAALRTALDLILQLKNLFLVYFLELLHRLLYSNFEVANKHSHGFAPFFLLLGKEVHLGVSLVDERVKLNHVILDFGVLQGFAQGELAWAFEEEMYVYFDDLRGLVSESLVKCAFIVFVPV